MSKSLRRWQRRRWRQDVVAAFLWGVVSAGLFAAFAEHVAGVSKMMGW